MYRTWCAWQYGSVKERTAVWWQVRAAGSKICMKTAAGRTRKTVPLRAWQCGRAAVRACSAQYGYAEPGSVNGVRKPSSMAVWRSRQVRNGGRNA